MVSFTVQPLYPRRKDPPSSGSVSVTQDCLDTVENRKCSCSYREWNFDDLLYSLRSTDWGILASRRIEARQIGWFSVTVHDIDPEEQSEQFRIGLTVSWGGIGCAFVVKWRCRVCKCRLVLELTLPSYPSCSNHQHLIRINLLNYPLSYRVPVRERYGSTLLPATREQHDQNCTQSH